MGENNSILVGRTMASLRAWLGDWLSASADLIWEFLVSLRSLLALRCSNVDAWVSCWHVRVIRAKKPP